MNLVKVSKYKVFSPFGLLNKNSKTWVGGLQTMKINFSQFWQRGSPRLKHQQFQHPVRAHFLVHKHSLTDVLLVMGSLSQGTDPVTKTTLTTQSLTKGPTSKQQHFEDQVSIYDIVGDINIQYIAMLVKQYASHLYFSVSLMLLVITGKNELHPLIIYKGRKQTQIQMILLKVRYFILCCFPLCN